MTRVLAGMTAVMARACLASLLLAMLCGGARAESATAEVAIVTAAGTARYMVEVADNAHDRRLGLMYRESMPADHGMLLHFGRPQPVSIWMKNTLIPLDLLYIDGAGVIVKIVEHTEPLSLALHPSGRRVVAVLELNAGQAAQRGIRVGDRVSGF